MTSERPLSIRSRAGRWLREQRLRRGYRTAAELGRAIVERYVNEAGSFNAN